ncbi:Acetyl-/propionyl-coenzyme A carboxylase alpha chain [Pseudovibrio axinellae]|uniref:Acetyl-/propionyl-coenzyme A carboxylase alpha chain n=1 Tax=Pseudovibrio axinellae TaxID=989403 RepID=A0A165SZT3_9HYPH|nr:acetyl/propionyl/methylcrotonyl-CoA carboxylase subunit alpha [Pseudovibrio axinellae]KZL05098.1 Acetyl-/propionyl-coenzyme A carboxylase alpha chain [Pseudovibrio axinellae]SER48204.1 3-methylcrotonyl-CoA carboxylase alpha subunit [Pseudovibrio axinellae]
MFRKILIANRGEIACRIAKSAKALGIKVVAVYSDADRDARHVQMADEAYRLGPPPVAESYLNVDALLKAAKHSGADAIHPGYGFLSENPEFVEAVEAAGLVFIGPPADAIRAMGLKDAAKALMEKSGVPVVPGYHGANQDAEFLKAESDKIGYPVLIKARAGGGGKGMRRVDAPADFVEALEGAQREGQSSFGDPRVLIEKYILSPRHIEVQVFCDGHGNAVHLFERDCSLQRRHQKVIEEAPAPGMTEEMRAAMGNAAVKAAQAVGYEGAGTVEFIVDGSDGLRADRFWFMEMNTRLQVEHPVTEAITGQDLVNWQFSVAAGGSLPKAQSDLSINGHSFEARIYAEDAEAGFLPATGTLKELKLPSRFARVDSGIRAGDTITPFYDPMIAKVITHGETREAALAKLALALEKSQAVGCTTNITFLHKLATHAGFMKGEMDTGLIDRELEKLTTAPTPTNHALALAALIELGFADAPAETASPWDTLTGWRQWSAAKQFAHLSWRGEPTEVSAGRHHDGSLTVSIEGTSFDLRILSNKGQHLRIDIDGTVITTDFFQSDTSLTLFMGENTWHFDLPDHLAEESHEGVSGNAISSPMPGQVRAVNCAAGDTVKEGETLIVTEAMKMEHSLTAPRDGIVAEVMAKAGDQVEEGAILLTLEEEDA